MAAHWAKRKVVTTVVYLAGRWVDGMVSMTAAHSVLLTAGEKECSWAGPMVHPRAAQKGRWKAGKRAVK